MEWSDKYSIGVREVDDQHKEVFKRLDWLVASGANEEAEMLDFVVNYLATHFASEEKLMKYIDYDEIDKHTAIHRSFTRKVDVWKDTLDAKLSNHETLKTEFVGFVAGWMIEHVLSVDMRLATAVKEFTKLALRDVDPKILKLAGIDQL
jgi:hemerythrin